MYQVPRKPRSEWDDADLCALLGQKAGLPVLVPRVLDRLEQALALDGDHFPDDLLVALLRIPSSYWTAHSAERVRVEGVIASLAES